MWDVTLEHDLQGTRLVVADIIGWIAFSEWQPWAAVASVGAAGFVTMMEEIVLDISEQEDEEDDDAIDEECDTQQ